MFRGYLVCAWILYGGFILLFNGWSEATAQGGSVDIVASSIDTPKPLLDKIDTWGQLGVSGSILIYVLWWGRDRETRLQANINKQTEFVQTQLINALNRVTSAVDSVSVANVGIASATKTMYETTEVMNSRPCLWTEEQKMLAKVNQLSKG